MCVELDVTTLVSKKDISNFDMRLRRKIGLSSHSSMPAGEQIAWKVSILRTFGIGTKTEQRQNKD